MKAVGAIVLGFIAALVLTISFAMTEYAIYMTEAFNSIGDGYTLALVLVCVMALITGTVSGYVSSLFCRDWWPVVVLALLMIPLQIREICQERCFFSDTQAEFFQQYTFGLVRVFLCSALAFAGAFLGGRKGIRRNKVVEPA